MAKALLIPAPVVPVPTPEIQLTLTQAEAETLQYLVGKITGSAQTSRRKHTAAIFEALDAAGIRSKGKSVPKTYYEYYSIVQFANEEGI